MVEQKFRSEHTLIISEEDRQMILMELAHLSCERPGWDDALARIAERIDNKNADGQLEMFSDFKRMAGGAFWDIIDATGLNVMGLVSQIYRELRDECGITADDVRNARSPKAGDGFSQAMRRQILAVMVGVIYRQAIDVFIAHIIDRFTGSETQPETDAIVFLVQTAIEAVSHHILDDDARRKARQIHRPLQVGKKKQ